MENAKGGGRGEAPRAFAQACTGVYRRGGTDLLRFALVQDLDVLVAAYAGQTPYVCSGEVGDLIIWLLLLRWEGRRDKDKGASVGSSERRRKETPGRDPIMHIPPARHPDASGDAQLGEQVGSRDL